MSAGSSSKISSIVRFHDFRRLPVLELALKSLGEQSHKEIELILVTQDLGANEKSILENKIKDIFVLNLPERSFKILDLPNPDKKDLRSKALNLGLGSATGHYLAFLDFDDVIEPKCYETLIQSLTKNPAAAVAAGKCIVEFGDLDKGAFLARERIDAFSWGKNIVDFYTENFLPIHSFVLNRRLVHSSDLFFDEDMDLSEDYAFLLRIASKYDFDFSNMEILVARYRSYDSLESSNPSMTKAANDVGTGSREAALQEKAARSEKRIAELKSRLPVRLKISELVALLPKRQKLSPIRAALTGKLAEYPALREKVVWIAGVFGIRPRKF